jgi:hypothetical protein
MNIVINGDMLDELFKMATLPFTLSLSNNEKMPILKKSGIYGSIDTIKIIKAVNAKKPNIQSSGLLK